MNKKRCMKIMVLSIIIFIFGGIVLFSKKHIPVLILKEKNFDIEYGEIFKPTFKNIVNVKGLNKDEIKYLKNNVKINSYIQNEEQKDYPAVGKYKVVIKYNDQQSIVYVTCRDTKAPNIEVLKNVEIVEGTNLDSFDFIRYLKITDLSNLADIEIDSSTVDVNKAGEYKAKVTVEDIYHNKAESELVIVVIKQKKDANVSSKNMSKYTNQNNLDTNQSYNLKEENKIDEEKSEVIKQEDPQSHQQLTIYWYECRLCGAYVESRESLDDAKKIFYETKCTDEIEKSGIDWRHSRYHYGINHS